MKSLLVAHIEGHVPPSVRGGALENNAPPIRSYGWRIIFQRATPKSGPAWMILYVAHLAICATPKNLIGGAYTECATPKSLGVAHSVNAPPIRFLGVAHVPNAPPSRA